MKTLHNNYCNSKQGYLPLFLSDYLDLLDPVLTFDRLMGGIDLNKYLTDIPEYTTGRLRYNPVNMLKTVLFGFMTSGYCSLRELEDNCKVNIRFMYLMDHQTPSYRILYCHWSHLSVSIFHLGEDIFSHCQKMPVDPDNDGSS